MNLLDDSMAVWNAAMESASDVVLMLEKDGLWFVGRGRVYGSRVEATRNLEARKRRESEERSASTWSAEADKALAYWEKRRTLPADIPRGTYLQALDALHRLDKVPWETTDGIPGVYAIVRWAVTEWKSGMIQSPSKLRQRSRAYPELKVHQVIANQIVQQNVGAASSTHYQSGDTSWKQKYGSK